MLRCDHCLLEFPDREAVRDPAHAGARVFCCTGCLGVFRLIAGEGLEAFYAARRWEERGLTADPERPVAVAAFEPGVREVDGLSEIDLYVDGIRCASCVWLNERLLASLPRRPPRAPQLCHAPGARPLGSDRDDAGGGAGARARRRLRAEALLRDGAPAERGGGEPRPADPARDRLLPQLAVDDLQHRSLRRVLPGDRADAPAHDGVDRSSRSRSRSSSIPARRSSARRHAACGGSASRWTRSSCSAPGRRWLTACGR